MKLCKCEGEQYDITEFGEPPGIRRRLCADCGAVYTEPHETTIVFLNNTTATYTPDGAVTWRVRIEDVEPWPADCAGT